MSRLTDEQTIQVRINTAVDEALSANNAKWREKIEEHNGFCDLGGGINICISEEQWQSILSQMEEE